MWAGRTKLGKGAFLAGCALALLPSAPVRADTEPPIALHYITDLIGDAAGGRQHGVNWLSRFDVTLASGDRMLGIDGAHAQVDVMLLHGGGFSAERSGDYQVVSNIDAPFAVRPYEAWVEMPVGSRMRAKAGVVDLNSEFDVQTVGALFLNSSFGIGPDLSQSGPNGPSIFPVTAPGMVVAYQPPGWSAKFGLFDARAGDPDRLHRTLPDTIGHDGALLIGEGHAQVGPLVAVQAGLWSYTDAAPRIDGRGKGTSAGGYAMIEARLLDGAKGKALRGWLRAGGATGETNPIAAYAGGGLTWGSERALYGIAVAHARQGGPAYRAGFVGARAPDRAETAFEATARWHVLPGLALQPDAQYVRHPGWNPTIPDAVVLALRLDWIGLIGR